VKLAEASPIEAKTAAPEKPAPAPKPEKPATSATAGSLVVQVAAFSTRERADKAAADVGGWVEEGGRYWRLRMGPFASGEDAQAALAKARAAGYGDARILHAG
jgi:rare lipoprotein A